MSRFNTAMAGVILATLTVATLFAEEGAQAFWGITDPLAQPSFNRWTLAEQQAMERYERAVTAANQKLREELDVVQQRLVGAGKLEEAIKVKAAIDDLNQGQGPIAGNQDEPKDDPALLRPALARKLHGTRWKHQDGWTVTFDARDMSLTASAHQAQGTWAVVSHDTIRSSPHSRHCQGYMMKIDQNGSTMVEPNGTTWTLVSRP